MASSFLLEKDGRVATLIFNRPEKRNPLNEEVVLEFEGLLHQVRDGNLNFPDTDFDTGRKTAAAEYPLADVTYARLVQDLSKNNFAQMTPELRSNILDFYSNLNAPYHNKKNHKSWKKTLQALDKLKSWQGNPVQSQLDPADQQ